MRVSRSSRLSGIHEVFVWASSTLSGIHEVCLCGLREFPKIDATPSHDTNTALVDRCRVELGPLRDCESTEMK